MATSPNPSPQGAAQLVDTNAYTVTKRINSPDKVAGHWVCFLLWHTSLTIAVLGLLAFD